MVINISNKLAYTFIAFGIIILLAVGVSATVPNPGHPISAIEPPNGDCPTTSPYIIYSGGWQCASAGDITRVTAGTGLTGGGPDGDVTLSADTSYLQRRVSSSCAVNSSIRVINADGTVQCDIDDVGGGSGGGGWTDGGTSVYLTTSTDKVGIGTTSPLSNLHVTGSIASPNSLIYGSNTAVAGIGIKGEATSTTSTGTGVVGVSAGSGIGVSGISTSGIGVKGDGPIGVQGYSGSGIGVLGSGTTWAGYFQGNVTATAYCINGANCITSWPSGGGSDSDWQVSGNNMYSIPSGNVGIGTSSPAYKLDVSGDIKTSGDIRVGNVIRPATSGGNVIIQLG